ncbi:uncharacterized protein PHACADRAFT_189778 [Phanerochaete carnosa HHB-10118-sp]|uniref:Glycoside hydrolase family 16 protein n=1 Tax=Phanerochaete carnosa (strain HHB-10118-sp) TaxID=650164 RepID=K5W9L9_PHACS|nr:uncharacterized protein PHACADRAFT_189778 [Phanerochaete carnosa HHB-10118-sp]EKM60653.1 hypothetical protein PHACADRAFT_189778 [Phanerochaete carnosa HHB-10118-sp]
MPAIRLLSTTLFAAGTLAASLPSLASLQASSGICGSVGEVSLNKIEVWSGATKLGFLAPDVSGLLGGGYGIISPDTSDALTGVFTCGAPTNPVTMGAANAQTVPGTNVNAIGLIAPYYPNGGSPDLASGGSNWLALGATYVSPSGAKPNATGITFGDSQAWFESSVWTTSGGYDGNGNYHDYILHESESHWVNSDGDLPSLLLAALPDQGGIVVTGDFNAFADSYSYVGNWVEVQLASAPASDRGGPPPQATLVAAVAIINPLGAVDSDDSDDDDDASVNEHRQGSLDAADSDVGVRDRERRCAAAVVHLVL